MDNHQKRNLTFLTIGLIFMLSGIEYGKFISNWISFQGCFWHINAHVSTLLCCSSVVASAVILPTIWRYLQILEAPPYFLGLGLSAFSLSALVTGPLFGIWSDRSKTTKSIVLFSNVFEIVGK